MKDATLQELRARLAEINAEIRAYPQPIARCDAQLGGLVDERSRLPEALDRHEETSADDSNCRG